MKRILTAVSLCLSAAVLSAQSTGPFSQIQTVFLIVMENHNWSDIKGNSTAPYINQTLLTQGAHAERYNNPTDIHPSLPNYLWLEAGQNFGILDDNDPAQDHQRTTQHLVTQLESAGITWKAYEEDTSGTSCPLTDSGNYAVRHDPFVYFDDVSGTNNPASSRCISHVRPYTELATDLKNNTVARYNFITPNVCHDMHDCSIQTGDSWLATEVPKITASTAYQHAVIFITWDEAGSGDGPIGFIALSPFAKKGYSNTVAYTHSSTLRTLQEIFGVTPLLGDAANATDLADLFVAIAAPRPPTNVRIIR